MQYFTVEHAEYNVIGPMDCEWAGAERIYSQFKLDIPNVGTIQFK